MALRLIFLHNKYKWSVQNESQYVIVFGWSAWKFKALEDYDINYRANTLVWNLKVDNKGW